MALFIDYHSNIAPRPTFTWVVAYGLPEKEFIRESEAEAFAEELAREVEGHAEDLET
jgi:hypothetical protein